MRKTGTKVWLTEAAEKRYRGRMEGISAAMPLLSIVAFFGGFMSFTLGKSESRVPIFRMTGSEVCVIGLLGLVLIREGPVRTGENQNGFENIFTVSAGPAVGTAALVMWAVLKHLFRKEEHNGK